MMKKVLSPLSTTINSVFTNISAEKYISLRYPVHRDSIIPSDHSKSFMYSSLLLSQDIRRERSELEQILSPLHQNIGPEKKERILKQYNHALDVTYFNNAIKKIGSNEVTPSQLIQIEKINDSIVIPPEDKKWMIYEIINGSIICGNDALYTDHNGEVHSKFKNYTLCAGSYDPWTNGHQSVYERMILMANCKKNELLFPNEKQHKEKQTFLEKNTEPFSEYNIYTQFFNKKFKQSNNYLPAILIVKSTSKPEHYQTLTLIERAYIIRHQYRVPYPIILGEGINKEETTKICGLVQGQSGCVIKGARDENDRKHTATLYKPEKYGKYGASENTFVDIPAFKNLENVSSGFIKGKLSEYFLSNGLQFDKNTFFTSPTYLELKQFAPKEVFNTVMIVLEKKIREYWSSILVKITKEIEENIFIEKNVLSLAEWNKIPEHRRKEWCKKIITVKSNILHAIQLITVTGLNDNNPEKIDNNQIQNIVKVMNNVIDYMERDLKIMLQTENILNEEDMSLLISKIFPNKEQILYTFNNLENHLTDVLSIFISRLQEDSGSMFDK